MKNIFLILLSLLCFDKVFCQTADSTKQNNDSLIKTQVGTPIQWNCVRIIGSINLAPNKQFGQEVVPLFHVVYTDGISQLGGLPINAFRFQNVNQIANTQAGVFSVDGETPSILGARTEGTAYYINGVRVLEGFLPQLIE